ncbi:MAG: hypothetical protein WCO58_00965 [bacterium]
MEKPEKDIEWIESIKTIKNLLIGDEEVGEHTIKYNRLKAIENNGERIENTLLYIKKYLITLIFLLSGILLVLLFKN